MSCLGRVLNDQKMLGARRDSSLVSRLLTTNRLLQGKRCNLSHCAPKLSAKTFENRVDNVLDVHYSVIVSPNYQLCNRRRGQRPPILHELRHLSLKRKELGQPCLQIHTFAPELDAGRFRGNNVLDKRKRLGHALA